MTRLRAEDGVTAGLCVTGQRAFCKQHGFDFREFIRSGIEIDELAGIEDAKLAMAIEAAKAREAKDVQR